MTTPAPRRGLLPISGAVVAILGILSLGTAYLFGPLRLAKLGLIDDHEILRFLGPHHSIGAGEIFPLLTGDTEVGEWGEASRLRPAYYLFRIIESAIHQDDGSGWYLTRIVLAGLTAFGVSMLAFRILVDRRSGASRILASAAFALFFGLLTLTMSAWTDVAMRLGPSEIYLGPAMVVFAFGLVEAWRSPARMHGWVLLFVGYIVAVGCKENSLLLLAPLLVLYAFRFWLAHRKPLVIGMLVLAIAFTAYVALGVALGAASQGGDIYGNERSMYAFFALLPENPYVFVAFFILAMVVMLGWITFRSTPNPQSGLRGAAYRIHQIPASLAAGLVVVIVLGDAYFYQNYFTGNGFTPARYGFLSELAIVLGSLTAVATLADRRLRARVPRVLTAAATVVVMVIPPFGGQLAQAPTLRTSSMSVRNSTQLIFDQISTGIADLQTHDGTQAVVFVDDAYLEYERAYSLPQFLAYYGETQGVYLHVDLPISGQDKLRSDLTDSLNRFAKYGNFEDGWKILPDSKFDPNQYSVCFFFDDSPKDMTECSSTHKIG